MTTQYALGVDLGTTQTAAAVRVDDRIEVVRLGARRAEIPSLIFVQPDGALLIGEAAERRGAAEPARLAREFKRRIGDPVPILAGGVPFSAHALTGKLLRHVLDTVSAVRGGPPAVVTLTHPANWGPYKREQLDQAVRIADAGPVLLRTEPEAAALQHATARRIASGETVAVYDLGGGTFDAAVLRRDGDGFTVLGEPEGIEQLGGADFDEAVFAHVLQTLGSTVEALDPDEPAVTAALARLRRDCVEAKEALSFDTEVMIPVALPGLHTRVRLNRSELEAMIAPSLADTVAALRRALRSAGVGPEQISAVLLAGGSSRIPLVGQLLSTALGRPVVADPHPEHSVAMGAAAAGVVVTGGPSPFASAVAPTAPTPAAQTAETTQTAATTQTAPAARAAETTQTLPAAQTAPAPAARAAETTQTAPAARAAETTQTLPAAQTAAMAQATPKQPAGAGASAPVGRGPADTMLAAPVMPGYDIHRPVSSPPGAAAGGSPTGGAAVAAPPANGAATASAAPAVAPSGPPAVAPGSGPPATFSRGTASVPGATGPRPYPGQQGRAGHPYAGGNGPGGRPPQPDHDDPPGYDAGGYDDLPGYQPFPHQSGSGDPPTLQGTTFGAPEDAKRGPGRRLIVISAALVAVLAAGTLAAVALLRDKDNQDEPSKGQAAAPSAASPAPALPFPIDTMLVRVDSGGDQPPQRKSAIYLLTPGGDQRTKILDTGGDILPEWSHRRDQIAETRATGDSYAIWVANADGSNPRQVIGDVTGGRVAWSADDSKLAFIKKVGGVPQIFVIKIGEKTPKQLTSKSSAKDDPAWSPDGKSIAYWVSVDGVRQIFLLDVARPVEPGRQLTRGAASPGVDPAWSPDGRQIAYTHSTGPERSDIWLMNADGSNAHALAKDPAREMDPTFAPDGTWVAFTRGVLEKPKITIVKLDGSDERTLTKGAAREGHPCWS